MEEGVVGDAVTKPTTLVFYNLCMLSVRHRWVLRGGDSEGNKPYISCQDTTTSELLGGEQGAGEGGERLPGFLPRPFIQVSSVEED